MFSIYLKVKIKIDIMFQMAKKTNFRAKLSNYIQGGVVPSPGARKSNRSQAICYNAFMLMAENTQTRTVQL